MMVILFILATFGFNTCLAAWQENVRPKMYVQLESTTPKKIRLHPKETEIEVEREVLNDNPSTSTSPPVLKTYGRKRKHTPEADDFLEYSSSEHSSNISDRILRMPFQTLSPKCRKLRYKLADLKKQLNANKIRNVRSSNKKKTITAHSILENLLSNSTAQVKTFVKMQCFRIKRRAWTKNERQLALSIYYKSPSCYKFLRNNLKFVLPSIRTIQEWLQTVNLQTGVNTNLVNLLAHKVQTMTALERQVVVLMDEISLKQDLKLNETLDEIEGFQDLGHLGKSDRLANCALVFYVRGLLKRWKFPFAYYTNKGPVPKNKLKLLVETVLQKLQEISLNPRVIVCDQGSNNRGVFSLLEATEAKPYFYLNDRKIYTIFDAPHLIKSFRNNFANLANQFYVDGKAVAWSDIKKTYELDRQSSSTRAMPKITPVHINPNNFQKMRVKYATQIFSRSVASTLKTVSILKSFNSDTITATAHFVQDMNDTFDILNSKNLVDPNKKKRPLSIYSEEQVQILENKKKMFQEITVFSKGREKTKSIYCIGGMIWTINAILLLWQDMKKNYKFLSTYNLNQDPIENFFSVVRHRGGYNPYPNCQQFRVAMQHNMFIRLQNESSDSNCELDEEIEHLTIDAQPKYVDSREHARDSNEDERVLMEDEPTEDVFVDQEISDTTSIEINLETCSNALVAGYLGFRVQKRYNCQKCSSIMIKSDDSFSNIELQIFHKDFGKEQISYLKKPTPKFNAVIQHLLKNITNFYEKYKLCKNIKTQMKQECFNLIKDDICCNDSHIDYLLKIFSKMMIVRININIVQAENLKKEQIRIKTKESRKTKILSSI